MAFDTVSNRTLGMLPLSIATSIAFEHLCGIKSEANPEPIGNQVGQYKEIWINYLTLFRNLYGALNKEDVKRVLPGEIADALSTEIRVIQDIVSQYSQGSTKVIFYLSNYKRIYSNKFKLANLRVDKTENQLTLGALKRVSIANLLKLPLDQDITFMGFENYLEPTQRVKSIILTHIAYDLVSDANFGQLFLLESHTGAIKGRDKWYTKFTDGKNLPMIPFVEMMLPIFGDSEHFFALDKKVREEILEVANRYHWSAVTTKDKILYGINQLKNPYLKEVLHSFL